MLRSDRIILIFAAMKNKNFYKMYFSVYNAVVACAFPVPCRWSGSAGGAQQKDNYNYMRDRLERLKMEGVKRGINL